MKLISGLLITYFHHNLLLFYQESCLWAGTDTALEVFQLLFLCDRNNSNV